METITRVETFLVAPRWLFVRIETSSGSANGLWFVVFGVATPTRREAVEMAPNRSATA